MTKWLLAGFCLFYTTAASAGIAILESSKAFREGDQFVNELTFTEAVSPDQVEIEYINQTIQANIKNVTINEGKHLKRVDDDKVKSVFTYQYQPDLMRSRIIHHKNVGADQFDGHVHVSAEGKTLKITVNNPNSPRVSEKTAALVNSQPPIDLDKELEKALKVAASESPDEMDSEESELMAAAATLGGIQDTSQKVTSKASDPSGEQNASSRAEAEIPLNIPVEKVKESESSPWARLFISLAVITVVGLGLVIGVKRFAKDKVKVGGNINVKVVSQHSLGPKKSLAVIHVAGESILIGITDHNISMIKSLALIDDEIQEDVPGNFETEIQKVSAQDRYTPSKPKVNASAEDDFSIGSIKDLVNSKLKEMRTL